MSALLAPNVIRTTTEFANHHFPLATAPKRIGMQNRFHLLAYSWERSIKDRTNEKEVSDSLEVRVQLVNGFSRKAEQRQQKNR
jgi:hypothetical protein